MSYLLILSLILTCFSIFATKAEAADYTRGVELSGSAATIWFKSAVNSSWVDVHYKVNGGVQQNFRMAYNASKSRYEKAISNIFAGSVITYSFTYNNGTPAYDTEVFTYTAGTTPPASSSGSIYDILPSSIPSPASGAVSVKVMNGTNGAYSDQQIYWGVIGINPANNKWSYLDLNGNLIPISTALNDAPGHLTKNGINYANIYHKVSDAPWATLPKITGAECSLAPVHHCTSKPITMDSPAPI